MSELDKKIQSSIRLIKTLDGLEPELAYSGGKDSDVILALAKMAGIKFRPIYKMTTIDPPGTIQHVKENGVEIWKPSLKFFEIVQKYGMPNFKYRICCKYLKEYKILDKCIQGIRSSESLKRKKRYKEPSQCRVYPGNQRSELFFPILQWTDDDVAEFVNHYGIKCAPIYYDENGVFDVKKRLGCMCCPLRSDHGLADFKRYPGFVRLWIRGGGNSSRNIQIARRPRNSRMLTTCFSTMFSANPKPTTIKRQMDCSVGLTQNNGLKIISKLT